MLTIASSSSINFQCFEACFFCDRFLFFLMVLSFFFFFCGGEDSGDLGKVGRHLSWGSMFFFLQQTQILKFSTDLHWVI